MLTPADFSIAICWIGVGMSCSPSLKSPMNTAASQLRACSAWPSSLLSQSPCTSPMIARRIAAVSLSAPCDALGLLACVFQVRQVWRTSKMLEWTRQMQDAFYLVSCMSSECIRAALLERHLNSSHGTRRTSVIFSSTFWHHARRRKLCMQIA